MIAGRRDRRRSLIRSKAMVAAMARSLSSRDSVTATLMASSSELKNAASASPFGMPGSQPEAKAYLRQLSTLYAAGVLTDEEFHAASGRLLGS